MRESIRSISQPSMLACLLVVVWALVSTVVGMGHVALEPIPNDGALYAYVSHLWLQGNIPYLAVWEHKPPGIFALGAMVFWILPSSLTILAMVEGVFILSSILMIVLFVRELGGSWVSSSLAGVCASMACNSFFYHDSNNLPEVYLILPVIVSMYCFIRADHSFKGRWIFFAGVCSGIASIFKPTGLIPYIAQVAFLFLLWVCFQKISLKEFLVSTMTNTVGVGIAWLPCVLYFGLHNGLLELFDAAFLYNVKYGAASQKPFYVIPFDILENIQILSGLVVCALCGLGIFLIHFFSLRRYVRPYSKVGTRILFFLPLVLLWNLGDLCGALAGGRNYTHYFLPLTASLSVTAGVVYALEVDRLSRISRLVFVRAFIILLLVGPLLFSQASDIGAMGRLLVNPPSFTYAWRAVAEEIKTRQLPGDTLFIWDYLPAIYFETKMQSPSRNLDARNLAVWKENMNQQQSDEIWQELWHDLKEAPPRFLVEKVKSAQEVQRGGVLYKQFRGFVDSRYTLIYEYYGHQLYELKGKVDNNAPQAARS